MTQYVGGPMDGLYVPDSWTSSATVQRHISIFEMPSGQAKYIYRYHVGADLWVFMAAVSVDQSDEAAVNEAQLLAQNREEDEWFYG